MSVAEDLLILAYKALQSSSDGSYEKMVYVPKTTALTNSINPGSFMSYPTFKLSSGLSDFKLRSIT
jgi:hypothetical protein